MDTASALINIATSTEPTSSVNILAVDIVNKFQEIFGFLVSGELQHNIFLVKIIFIIFSFFCLAGVIYLYKKTGYLHYDQLETWDILKNFKDYGSSKAQKQWRKIKQNFEKDDPVYWKVALLEAEKLMDEILVRMGLGSGTMDERLSRASVDEIPNLQDVIRARNLCQDIARDPDYRLNKEDAEKTLGSFEKALLALQVF